MSKTNYDKGYYTLGNKAIIELKPHLFRTYSYLISKDYKNVGIYYSQLKMSEELKISVRTIQRHIKELKELGYISVKRRGFNMTNIYTMLKHIVNKVKEKSKEAKENFSKKFPNMIFPNKKPNTFVDYCQDAEYKNNEWYDDIEKKLLGWT